MQYKCPQLSLLIITFFPKTNKMELSAMKKDQPHQPQGKTETGPQKHPSVIAN